MCFINAGIFVPVCLFSSPGRMSGELLSYPLRQHQCRHPHPYAQGSDRNRKLVMPVSATVSAPSTNTSSTAPSSAPDQSSSAPQPPAVQSFNVTTSSSALLASASGTPLSHLISANQSLQSRVEAESQNIDRIRTSLMVFIFFSINNNNNQCMNYMTNNYE